MRPAGAWDLRSGLPPLAGLDEALAASPAPRAVRLDGAELVGWDASLALALTHIRQACDARRIPFSLDQVPEGVRALASLTGDDAALLATMRSARQRPALADALSRRRRRDTRLTDAVGTWAIAWARSLGTKFDFLGSTTLAFFNTPFNRRRRRDLEFLWLLQRAGVETVPVLAFFAFAAGGVLALLATQQLDRVGASNLAPTLVAVVILRELAALTTGIALAGRLGSANAAELGTMAAGAGLDALRAAGTNPFEALVAPRVLALAVAGPLLVLFANAIGLAGSVSVSVLITDTSLAELVDKTRSALTFKHAIAGLVKGVAYGVVVGLSGCYYGLRSSREPGTVGRAVQSGVVAAVLGVTLVDAVLTIFFKYVRL